MTRSEKTLLPQNAGDIVNQAYNQMQKQQCKTFFPVLATPDKDAHQSVHKFARLRRSSLHTVGETRTP